MLVGMQQNDCIFQQTTYTDAGCQDCKNMFGMFFDCVLALAWPWLGQLQPKSFFYGTTLFAAADYNTQTGQGLWPGPSKAKRRRSSFSLWLQCWQIARVRQGATCCPLLREHAGITWCSDTVPYGYGLCSLWLSGSKYSLIGLHLQSSFITTARIASTGWISE